MPLLTDTLLVTAFAESVEEAMGDDVLLLPTQWMGMSDHHLNFAGTVTANPELYTRWLVRTLETLLKHGFRKIFMLNGHGGNQVPANQALVELWPGYERPDTWIGFASYWHLGAPSIEKGHKEGIGGVRFESPMLTHADEWEYSLGLHVFPQLCQPEKAKAIPTDFKTDYYDVDLSKHVIGLSTPFTAFIPRVYANHPESQCRKGAALFEGIRGDLLTFFDEFKELARAPYSDGDMGQF